MKDGRITLDDGRALGPGMSSDAFRKTFPEACVGSVSDLVTRFVFGPVSVLERAFEIVTTFESGTLKTVILTDWNLNKVGWSGISDEMLGRSRMENDEWLRRILGVTDAKFSWGQVYSWTDMTAALPEIVVHYC
jgi:hypothetical protein